MDVFSFCGMPGCGKGVISDHLMEKNIPIFSLGDTVREHFQRDHPGRPAEETGLYANEQRELHGKEIWALRLIERIEKGSDGGILVIDGLRSQYERSIFQGRWGERFHVVSIFCPADVRYERLRERGRNDAPASRVDFDERDSRELGWGLGDLMALSDHMIRNLSTPEELCSLVDAFIEEVREGR